MQSIIPTLAVADVDATIAFYRDVLGFTPGMVMRDGDGNPMHAEVSRGDVMIMFGPANPSDPHSVGPFGRGVWFYTTVSDDEDVDALYDHARAAGATITQEPTDQFWGHRDWAVQDPDGYVTIVSKVIKDLSAQEMQDAALAMAPAD